MKNGFILYYDLKQVFSYLTDEEAGKMIKAVTDFKGRNMHLHALGCKRMQAMQIMIIKKKKKMITSMSIENEIRFAQKLSFLWKTVWKTFKNPVKSRAYSVENYVENV